MQMVSPATLAHLNPRAVHCGHLDIERCCMYAGETEYTAEFAEESGARGALMLNGTKLGGQPLSVVPQDRPVSALSHPIFSSSHNSPVSKMKSLEIYVCAC